MLSGGVVLGMFYLGVFKVMWENLFLFSIIFGFSVGFIMVLVVVIYIDDELEVMFDFEYIYVEVFCMVGWCGILCGKGILDFV